jgi:hypothetical protein
MGIAHWHASGDTDKGTDTFVSTLGDVALDALAHMLQDHSASYEDQTDSDSVYAEARYEQLCTCTDHERTRSDMHNDALAAVERGNGITELIGYSEFVLRPCSDGDCLKYCPDPECGSVAPIDDTDHKCWCCGKRYVPWDACAWLETATATA